MANETKNQPVIDIETAFDKTENYFEENKKSILLILGGIIALVGVYIGWKNFYQKPRNEEAATAMYPAQLWFQQDSFNLAVTGRGDTLGFQGIVDEYGMSKSGNLAHYYLGVCYLRTGKFDQAIEQLEEYDGDDKFTPALALGMIGDAHMEKKDADKAIDFYLKAADKNANKFTSPIYLKKAGLAYEAKGNNAEAAKLYEQIKVEFPESQEATQIDKYLARAKGASDVK
jgi:tetratricopeptide (TPR) repeat protein